MFTGKSKYKRLWKQSNIGWRIRVVLMIPKTGLDLWWGVWRNKNISFLDAGQRLARGPWGEGGLQLFENWLIDFRTGHPSHRVGAQSESLSFITQPIITP